MNFIQYRYSCSCVINVEGINKPVLVELISMLHPYLFIEEALSVIIKQDIEHYMMCVARMNKWDNYSISDVALIVYKNNNITPIKIDNQEAPYISIPWESWPYGKALIVGIPDSIINAMYTM